MSLTRRSFLGIATASAGALLFAPVFNTRPAAAVQSWAEELYLFDWGKNYGSAADGCSFPVISYPSKVEPQLVRHLENFRKN
jgi:spermidine/putrescine-binding protein